MVQRVNKVISRLLLMRCWTPHLRLAWIAFVLSMCTSVFPVGVVCLSRIGVPSMTPTSHSGAMCFRSLSEKLSGRHWVLICLSYSLGGRFFGMICRWLALVSSISLEALLRLMAMWLGVCRLGMCSNYAPDMCRMYDSTLRVGSLAWLAS